MTRCPFSNKATVVPTGASALPSPVGCSTVAANCLPESTKEANKLVNVALGSLYGNGINASVSLPPGTSTSRHSPG